MLDVYGREIEYLRISVTESCNLKCLYCMPSECAANSESLTPKEIGVFISAAANLGIKKVRVTGGEPLVRQDICDIISEISKVEQIDDISITTNAVLLGKLAPSLKSAGLNRVNISLDSLNPERFSHITGGGQLEGAIDGLKGAVKSGLYPVHVNTVLIKGINDTEIDDFIELTKENPIDVRFIELMPIGQFGEENKDKMVLNSDIISARPNLVPCGVSQSGQPATYYQIEGYKGRVGFISPISHKFCGSCNRIRLTSDGKLRPCLGQNGEESIVKIIRENPQILEQELKRIIYNKPKGHNFENSFNSSRSMNRIGG